MNDKVIIVSEGRSESQRLMAGLTPSGPHLQALVKDRALASGAGIILRMANSVFSQFALQERGTQNDSLFKSQV